jgi:5-formyltetrahydrofolate cyclo-ligase
MEVQTAKQLLRIEIWKKLEAQGIARFPLPCFGRIPNFEGSEEAAASVRLLDEWTSASVIFANPDYAQRKVREYALLDQKILIMASPRLKHGFVLVNPVDVKTVEVFASTIKGASKFGRSVKIEDMPRPDLISEGSVAVDENGHRLGKGGGYSDIEIQTLKRRFGVVPIVTTVHDIQVVKSVPFDEKDERITIIVTPSRTIRVISSA